MLGQTASCSVLTSAGCPIGRARLHAKRSAYLSLLQEKGVSGYHLSKKAGIQSSKIYSVLNRLLDNGFVIRTDTKPFKYFACPPEELLGKIERDLTETVSDLGDALNALQRGKQSKETTDGPAVNVDC